MNSNADAFVTYILNESPRHQKNLVEADVSSKFNLVKDGKVYHNDCFAVRFCYSKKNSTSFSNTVLALSVLEKYDRIPFFVVLVRKEADNIILLANSTFLKKISHSSTSLATNNIRGSFNGSDIIRSYNGISNTPNHFDEMIAIHLGMEWEDNLERLVEATRGIAPRTARFVPDEEGVRTIYNSVDRAIHFVESPDYMALLEDLNGRCRNCENEIKIAAHIENNNIRGRLIESLITADKDERARLLRDMVDIETQLPLYDTRNSLGDYIVHFRNHDVYTDIKTKIIYLNSNPKAYNVDKFLRHMAEDKSVFNVSSI